MKKVRISAAEAKVFDEVIVRYCDRFDQVWDEDGTQVFVLEVNELSGVARTLGARYSYLSTTRHLRNMLSDSRSYEDLKYHLCRLVNRQRAGERFHPDIPLPEGLSPAPASVRCAA